MDFFKYTVFFDANFVADIWVKYLVGGLCFALVYVFQAIALYTIAKREGYNNVWMAFVPFVNTYYIGVCGQKNRTFRTVDTKTIAMIAAVVEALLFAGNLVYNVAVDSLQAADCFYVASEDTVIGTLSYLEVSVTAAAEEGLNWAAWCYNYLNSYVLIWFDIAFLFLQFFVLSAFFQTYASRRYLIFTLTSILFPIRGIFFFIVRNNRGVNYREFLYAEQARQYNMYRQYQNRNPYDNPYNGTGASGPANNPYADPPQGGQNVQTPPEDPFGDMGNNDKNDPFS